MHYKNGREINKGDWCVGPTHNSENRVAIGFVLDLMEAQGTCNVKLRTFPFVPFEKHSENDSGDLVAPYFPNFHGRGVFIESFRPDRWDKGDEQKLLWCHIDYADSKKLFRIDDAFKAIDAIYDHAMHDSPYFPVSHQ